MKYFEHSADALTPQTTIEDVFEAVQSGRVRYGVAPFENSTNGSVAMTLNLLRDVPSRNPDILVCGEAYVDVHHCLLGWMRPLANARSSNTDPTAAAKGPASPPGISTVKKPRVEPLTDLQHIKRLYSHPQAWTQCTAFLETYLSHAKREDVSSTSRAAELVASDTSGTTAAISSEIAASVHKVDFLAKGIEDSQDNTTRFLVLRKGPVLKDTPSPAALSTDAVSDGARRYKSLITFTVKHDDPGALAKALAVFQPYGLNMTNIEKRPSGEAPFHYVFFVEVLGKREDGEEGAVNAALRDLQRVTGTWRWLGSWESRWDG